jgi:hypothetical protein
MVTLMVFGHMALVVSLLAGYVSAFYKAKSIAQGVGGQLWWKPSPFRRALSMVFCAVWPVVAAVGVCLGWRGPLIPQFVGCGINVTFFNGRVDTSDGQEAGSLVAATAVLSSGLLVRSHYR